MINYKINRNSLYVNGINVDFKYEIDNVKMCNRLLIILLDIPSNIKDINNVYAVDSLGNILWQVQDASTVYSVINDVPYVGTRIIENDKIIVTNFNGVTYTIESSNGKIIDRGCTK